jgi:hypothetical protein
VQHPDSSAAQVDGTEPSKQPENQEDDTKDKEQPKANLVGANTTNHEQAIEHKIKDESNSVDKEEKPEVQAVVGEEGTGKAEEKIHEDHGGEELVEGQEDDVMY